MTEKKKRDQGPFTVVAKVISQEGHCAAGHQVGADLLDRIERILAKHEVRSHAYSSFMFISLGDPQSMALLGISRAKT
ncbi:MAG: hypothetical protein ABIK79_16040 [Chloroflexota bacterium]